MLGKLQEEFLKKSQEKIMEDILGGIYQGISENIVISKLSTGAISERIPGGIYEGSIKKQLVKYVLQ